MPTLSEFLSEPIPNEVINGKQYDYSLSAKPTSFNTSEAFKLLLYSWLAYQDEDGFGTMRKDSTVIRNQIFSEGIRKSLANGFGGIVEQQVQCTTYDISFGFYMLRM